MTKFYIPDGYRRLEPGEQKQQGDLVWESWEEWMPTKCPGDIINMGSAPTVRKIPDHPEYGSW